MTRVCHISPVHNLHDNRIFYKQCRSLHAAGYDVHFVVQHDKTEELYGVKIIPLKKTKSRWRRWFATDWQALRAALKTDADIYQFHDMEFIPQGLILRLLGKSVVYDIHEDYATSLPQKPYLPKLVGKFLGAVFSAVEKAAASFFKQIIAERCYASRFPKATVVLNYPVHVEHDEGRRSPENLLYTGTVLVDRGAMEHSSIPSLVDDVSVHFFGLCTQSLHDRMLKGNPDRQDKLHFQRLNQFVPFKEILEQYQTGSWLAGLAIFPPTVNYQEKELTKLFEYMQYGLPIIASDFPTWKRIIEPAGCGFCVDPTDPNQIRDAVTQLRDDPVLWETMSRNGIEAAKQYTWESQCQNLLQLYGSMLPRREQERGAEPVARSFGPIANSTGRSTSAK